MQHDAPLTRFLGDLIRTRDGRLTMADIRKRWSAGEYRGVRDDWAKKYVEMVR